MNHKLIATLVGLMALVGLNSCLVTESTITLNKDGSGTVTEAVYFDKKVQQMMGMGGEAGNPIEAMLDIEKSKERAKQMGEGVTFVKAEAAEKGALKGAISVYAFQDINQLRYNGPEALGSIAEQAAPELGEKEKKQNFFYEDGVLTLKNDEDDMGLGELGELEDIDPAQLEMVKEMFAGMRMTMKLVFEGGIEETNASFVEGNSVITADVQVDKMLQNAEALKKISEIEDRDAAAQAFNAIEGVKVEPKQEVSIKLK